VQNRRSDCRIHTNTSIVNPRPRYETAWAKLTERHSAGINCRNLDSIPLSLKVAGPCQAPWTGIHERFERRSSSNKKMAAFLIPLQAPDHAGAPRLSFPTPAGPLPSAHLVAGKDPSPKSAVTLFNPVVKQGSVECVRWLYVLAIRRG